MLHRLHITNYLLIEELDLNLAKGLTIITGETGSGKSILIGALGLVMGERADAGTHRDPSKRCVMELEVDLSALDLRKWFDANELPFEKHTIIRRQLEPVKDRDGSRSRAFVNDTPVKLEQLRELGAQLVHVHSQHHTQLLNDPGFQLGLIDHVAGHSATVSEFTSEHTAWRKLVNELNELCEQEARSKAELDFFTFQLNELDEAGLKAGELEQIEQELTRAENATELIEALTAVDQGVNSERGVLTMLGKLQQTLVKPARVDAEVQALLDRLNSATIELKDIAGTAEDIATTVSLDPEQAKVYRDRTDLIHSLLQKHRVKTVEELTAIQDELRSKTEAIGSLGERIGSLEKEEGVRRNKLITEANTLSKARVKAMVPLAKKVAAQLHELGMPNAIFKFDHSVVEQPGPQGLDIVRALFTANKDRTPAPLDKVASGGELSRVMLALISLAADSQDLPTVIFDEIDTGVSGEVADRVGTLMAKMGKHRQVLAITHLPQIASKAQNHLLVTKASSAESVLTSISPLTMDQRVEAIAQMLSGRKLTKAALENARVLLKG
ncbi:MAG: DNA repair protein RecN [Flavobacteriales bacterium]|nr:DNA repair protein RecN [Flavobacteriales bacterium]